MKPGQSSKTAELVCMGRAVAHGNTDVRKFSDPTALSMLSDEARARVASARRQQPSKGLSARLRRLHLTRLSQAMVPRTVEIDDAIRAVASPQLAILGAGLDGRAWRMKELQNVSVFEVDHPDSQREKRARVQALTPMSGDIRFVPVDFVRDSLDAALSQAGHDPAKPTTWVWEGVVMYLALADIEATLSVIAKRSAPRSRLIVAYHSPALMLHLVGFLLGRLGEPLRSAFTPREMQRLLAKYGFDVARDEDIHTIGAGLSADIGRSTSHLRIVTADRVA